LISALEVNLSTKIVATYYYLLSLIKNKKEQHPAKPDSQALNSKHGVKWLSDMEKFFSAAHAQRGILLVNPCRVREA
jgi:hypothetical protein